MEVKEIWVDSACALARKSADERLVNAQTRVSALRHGVDPSARRVRLTGQETAGVLVPDIVQPVRGARALPSPLRGRFPVRSSSLRRCGKSAPHARISASRADCPEFPSTACVRLAGLFKVTIRHGPPSPRLSLDPLRKVKQADPKSLFPPRSDSSRRYRGSRLAVSSGPSGVPSRRSAVPGFPPRGPAHSATAGTIARRGRTASACRWLGEARRPSRCLALFFPARAFRRRVAMRHDSASRRARR